MWPRLALWVAGAVAIPAAKWVWDKILETPSYYPDVAKANAERAAKEQAEKDELVRLRNQLSAAGREANEKFFSKKEEDKDILFRKFDI